MFSILLSWTLFYSCCFWSLCISFSCRCQKVSKGLFSVVKKLLLFWSFWSHHMTLMIDVLKWTSSGSPYLPLPTSGWGQIRDVDIKHEHSPNNEVSVWAKFSVFVFVSVFERGSKEENSCFRWEPPFKAPLESPKIKRQSWKWSGWINFDK